MENRHEDELAEEYKNKGNELLKKGPDHYAEAIDCYSEAINQNSTNPEHMANYYCNRAFVYMNLRLDFFL